MMHPVRKVLPSPCNPVSSIKIHSQLNLLLHISSLENTSESKKHLYSKFFFIFLSYFVDKSDQINKIFTALILYAYCQNLGFKFNSHFIHNKAFLLF